MMNNFITCSVLIIVLQNWTFIRFDLGIKGREIYLINITLLQTGQR